MSSEKYKLFRNYMSNELGITRNDIEQWTKEAIENEVKRRIPQINLESVAYRVMTNNLIMSHISKNIVENLDIKIEYKK